ncbi:DNRLRE domain-containing protein [Candidatus Aenigmatarchaeota archaeon]
MIKQFVIFLILIFTLFFIITPTHGSTYTRTPIDDSYVNEYYYDTRFPINELRAGKTLNYTERTYLKFDLLLPENIEIKYANLTLFHDEMYGERPKDYAVYDVYSPFWHQDSITWRNQFCGNDFDNDYFCDLEPLDVVPVSESGIFYTWDITKAVERAYQFNKRKITLVLKLYNESEYTGYNVSKFAQLEESIEIFRPHLRIDYENVIDVTPTSPQDNEFLNSAYVTFSCDLFGNISLRNVTFYSDLYSNWKPIVTNTSGIINTTYTFTLPVEKDGEFSWNCMSIDIDNKISWGIPRVFIIDRSIGEPQLIDTGNTLPNPYKNITLYSKWWGHMDDVIAGIVEEDSSGEIILHPITVEDGWINFTIENTERNQIINYRFRALNNEGWNTTDWFSLTIDDYWEPQDKYFQSFKRTLDYVKDNLYTKGVGPHNIPISQDFNENYTLPRMAQTAAMHAALRYHLYTGDTEYLDMANDIADWMVHDQIDDYYRFLGYYTDISSYYTLSSFYGSAGVISRMLDLSSVTGNKTHQYSAERALNYHIEHTWDEDHFKTQPGYDPNPVKINTNAQGMRVYAYACYLINESYCYYANKTAYWVISQQDPSGSWPYRVGELFLQPEYYDALTTEGFAEGVYWLQQSEYYTEVPAEITQSLTKAFENINNRSNEGYYFYNDDGAFPPGPGASYQMIEFANLFSTLALLEKNSTKANWTWKQLDYMIDLAPGKQNEDGSWDDGDLTVSDNNVSTWKTSFTLGVFADLLMNQNKPRELLKIHDNVCWKVDEPKGIINISLKKHTGDMLFRKTIYSINTKPFLIDSWKWNITEILNFSTNHVTAFDSDGNVNFVTSQNGMLFNMYFERTGEWSKNEGKFITYEIKSNNLNVFRTAKSNAVEFSFISNTGDLTTRNLELTVPGNFIFDGNITYMSNNKTTVFSCGIDAICEKHGSKITILLKYFVPVLENNKIVLKGHFRPRPKYETHEAFTLEQGR